MGEDNALKKRDCNGKTKKTVRTEKGSISIDVPRDREGSFEPQLIQKGQTRSGFSTVRSYRFTAKA